MANNTVNPDHKWNKAKGIGFIGFGVILLMGLINLVLINFYGGQFQASVINIGGQDYYFPKYAINTTDPNQYESVDLGGESNWKYYIWDDSMTTSFLQTPGSNKGSKLIKHFVGDTILEACDTRPGDANKCDLLKSTSGSGVGLKYTKVDVDNPDHFDPAVAPNEQVQWQNLTVETLGTYDVGKTNTSVSTSLSLVCQSGRQKLQVQYVDPDYEQNFHSKMLTSHDSLDLYNLGAPPLADASNLTPVERKSVAPGTHYYDLTQLLNADGLFDGDTLEVWAMDYRPYSLSRNMWRAERIVFQNPCGTYTLNANKSTVEVGETVTVTAGVPSGSHNGKTVTFNLENLTSGATYAPQTATISLAKAQANIQFSEVGNMRVTASINGVSPNPLEGKNADVNVQAGQNHDPSTNVSIDYNNCRLNVSYNGDVDWDPAVHTDQARLFYMNYGVATTSNFSNIEYFGYYPANPKVWTTNPQISNYFIDLPLSFKNLAPDDSDSDPNGYRIDIFPTDFKPGTSQIDDPTAKTVKWGLKRSEFPTVCPGQQTGDNNQPKLNLQLSCNTQDEPLLRVTYRDVDYDAITHAPLLSQHTLDMYNLEGPPVDTASDKNRLQRKSVAPTGNTFSYALDGQTPALLENHTIEVWALDVQPVNSPDPLDRNNWISGRVQYTNPCGDYTISSDKTNVGANMPIQFTAEVPYGAIEATDKVRFNLRNTDTSTTSNTDFATFTNWKASVSYMFKNGQQGNYEVTSRIYDSAGNPRFVPANTDPFYGKKLYIDVTAGTNNAPEYEATINNDCTITVDYTGDVDWSGDTHTEPTKLFYFNYGLARIGSYSSIEEFGFYPSVDQVWTTPPQVLGHEVDMPASFKELPLNDTRRYRLDIFVTDFKPGTPNIDEPIAKTVRWNMMRNQFNETCKYDVSDENTPPELDVQLMCNKAQEPYVKATYTDVDWNATTHAPLLESATLDLYNLGVPPLAQPADKNRIGRKMEEATGHTHIFALKNADPAVHVGHTVELWALDVQPANSVDPLNRNKWSSIKMVYDNPCGEYALTANKTQTQINQPIQFTAAVPFGAHTDQGVRFMFTNTDTSSDTDVPVMFDGNRRAVLDQAFTQGGHYEGTVKVINADGSDAYLPAVDPFTGKIVEFDVLGGTNSEPEYSATLNDDCTIDVRYAKDDDFDPAIHTNAERLWYFNLGEATTGSFSSITYFGHHPEPPEVFTSAPINVTETITLPPEFTNLAYDDSDSYEKGYRIDIFATDFLPGAKNTEEVATTIRWGLRRSDLDEVCAGQVVNTAPTCTVSVDPTSADEGSEFTFTATKDDDDGHQVDYTKLVINNGVGTFTKLNFPYKKTIDTANNYTATLTVKDELGKVGTCTTEFEVTDTGSTNNAPTCTLTVNPQTGEVGDEFTFNATKDDPDGHQVDYTKLVINNGVGTFTKLNFPYKKTINTENNFTATLTVKDELGKVGTCTANFEVTSQSTNTPPTCTLNAAPTRGDKPLPVTFSASMNDTDPGDYASGQTLSYGDGGVKQKPFGGVVNENHTYSASGNYTATLTVIDRNGATGTCTKTIKVDEPTVITPPTIDARASLNTITQFGQGQQSLSNVTPGADVYLHWKITKGTGNITNITVTPATIAGSVSQDLTTLNYGPATVNNTVTYTVTVRDSNNRYASDNVAINVSELPLNATFNATPTQTLPGGGDVTLQWTSTNAENGVIIGEPVLGAQENFTHSIPNSQLASGTTIASITESTIFTLTVKGGNKTITKQRTVIVPPPSSCTNDGKEPNNTAAQAASVDQGPMNLTVCPSDTDWFVVFAEEDDAINFRMDFSNAQNEDLDMYLYDTADAGASSVAYSSQTLTDFEEFTYTAEDQGYYYLKVKSYAAGTMPSSGVDYTLDANLGCLSDVSAANSTITVDPQNVPADGTSTSTITVTLRDSGDSPLPNTPVQLEGSSSACNQSGCNNSSFVIADITGTTDANGEFTTTMTSTSNEVVTVRAISTCVELDATAAVTFEGESYACSITASPSTIYTDGTASQISVEVTNVNAPSTPVVGSTVDFMVSGLTAGAGTFNPVSAQTNANSIAETLFTATETGDAVISATVDGKTCTGSTTVTVIDIPEDTGILQLTLPLQGRDQLASTDAGTHSYPMTVELEKKDADGTYIPVFTGGSATAWTADDGIFPADNAPGADDIKDVLYNLDTTPESNPYLIRVYSGAHLVDSAYIYISDPINSFTIDTPGMLAGNVSQESQDDVDEKITTADVIWFYNIWGNSVPDYTQYSSTIGANEFFIADLSGNLEIGAEDFSFIINNLGTSEPPVPPVIDDNNVTAYNGTYNGIATSADECGGATLSMVVDGTNVTGTALTTSDETLIVNGTLDAEGNVQGGWAENNEVVASFTGVFEASTGGSGTWEDNFGCTGTYQVTFQVPGLQ